MTDKDAHIVWHSSSVTKEMRSALKHQRACILWFTGLSGSGKSTIANAVERRLFEMGKHTFLLDGDNVRHGLNKGLSFSEADRIENIRRVGEVSKLFVEAGVIVLTAFISPFREDRELVKRGMQAEEFIEIFVDTPLEVCEQRDPKGLYKKARQGVIKQFTGIDSPYETPQKPDIHLVNLGVSIDAVAQQVITFLQTKNYI
jgi:adenylylsulfate kinase